MIDHVKQLADELAKSLPYDSSILSKVRALSQELEKLELKDFFADGRMRFIEVKDKLRTRAGMGSFTAQDSAQMARLGREVLDVLGTYAGEPSKSSFSFAFVRDAALREIIHRDYEELTTALIPARAWKSVIVLAGSILEAILQDQLTKDAAAVEKGRRICAGEHI